MHVGIVIGGMVGCQIHGFFKGHVVGSLKEAHNSENSA